MSTDNSREIAESYGAEIIDIPNGTFNWAVFLQEIPGIQCAKGELIYFTVQDAYLPKMISWKEWLLTSPTMKHNL